MRFLYFLPIVLYITTASSARLGSTKNSLESIPSISNHEIRLEPAQSIQVNKRGASDTGNNVQTTQGGQSAQSGQTQSFTLINGADALPGAVVNGAGQLPGQVITGATQLPNQILAGASPLSAGL